MYIRVDPRRGAKVTTAERNFAGLIDANDALNAQRGRRRAHFHLPCFFVPSIVADREFWHGERESARLDPADTSIRRCSK